MIYNIHALRGLSSLLVVLVHVTGPGAVLTIPRIGQGGVDIFFVISGFLMVHINRIRHPTPWAFLAQRMARIVPFYWMMTVAVFSIALAAPSLLSATTASWDELYQSLVFFPFRKSNGLIQPVLFVGWSLNYEMFFYAVFALGLCAKNFTVGVMATGSILLLLVVAGCLIDVETVAFRFYTDPVLLELASGMVIAFLASQRPAVRGLTSQILTMAAGITAMAVLIVGPIVTSWPPVLVCGLPATIVVAAAIRLEQDRWCLKHALVRRLGNASFGLYLTHPFVIQFVRLASEPWMHRPWAEWPVVVICFAGALVVGDLAHRLVERPLSTLALRISRGEPAFVVAGRSAGLIDGKLQP